MTWYAAHIVIGIKVVDDDTQPISIYENVVLIEAINPQDALAYAKGTGEEEAKIDDDGLEVNGKPAKRIFAGVRKLVNISNRGDLDQDQVPPVTGTEITYSEFEVEDMDALNRFANGDSLNVLYVE